MLVTAENPEVAAKYARHRMGTTYRDIVVYEHDDLFGDHPVPVHLPEEDT